MAAAPRFKIEHELATSIWMKRPRSGVQPPWEFFANLNVENSVSMRRIAEHLHYSLYHYHPADIEKRTTRTESFEVQRMLDEVNGREDKETRIHNKRKGGKRRREPVTEKTNELLFNVLDWFAGSWQESDEGVLGRAEKVFGFINIYVRQPNLYKVEHATARAEWERFERNGYREDGDLDMDTSPYATSLSILFSYPDIFGSFNVSGVLRH
jgi:hypothetical protein